MITIGLRLFGRGGKKITLVTKLLVADDGKFIVTNNGYRIKVTTRQE